MPEYGTNQDFGWFVIAAIGTLGVWLWNVIQARRGK